MAEVLEIKRTDAAYTLPLDEPLPTFSRIPWKMGITHQQFFNSYLERRTAYVTRELCEHRKPTITGFHAELVAKSGILSAGYTQTFTKIAGAILEVTEGTGKRNCVKGLSETSPFSVTSEGAARIVDLMRTRGKPRRIPVEVRAEQTESRAEIVGRFVLDNNYRVLDPRTGTIIDPRGIGSIIIEEPTPEA